MPSTTLESSPAPAPSPLACGSSQCRYLDEYCDAYESACRDCSKLCSFSEKFNECVELCNPYVKNILFSSDNSYASTSEITRLQIQLAILLAVSFAILFLLLFKIVLKCKKGRKTSSPEGSDVFELGNYCTRNICGSSAGSHRNSNSMKTSTSLPTVTSDLSGQTYDKRKRTPESRFSTTSTNDNGGRVPTEDKIPDGNTCQIKTGFDNFAMDTSPRKDCYSLKVM